jgi:hypothetical protein
MSILDQLHELLPEDWSPTLLTYLDPEWQVNATDGEMVASATGNSIENACDELYRNIEAGIYLGRLFCLDKIYREPTVAKKSLLAELGLDRPAVKINRRI